MARKRSRRHRGQKRWNKTRKSIQNAPQTPLQPIDDKNIRLYGKFSSSDFENDNDIISKCEQVIQSDITVEKKITALREILNIPQRRLFSTHTPSLSADVSPTSGQEQLANVSQTS